MVLGRALPGALGVLAPRRLSLGLFAAAFTTLISVALTMTYFCLDLAGRNWRFTAVNRPALRAYRANGLRNALLGLTLVFALGLVANGPRGWL